MGQLTGPNITISCTPESSPTLLCDPKKREQLGGDEQRTVRTTMEEEEHSPTKNPNPNFTTPKQQKPVNNTNTTKKKKCKNEEFEFCKVCNHSHDQGQRHKYFPNHTKSLSSFLSRFQTKLSDVRFFLKNPTFLRPEHSSMNRLWCVFCDSDIDELGSSFACSNAINHLASSDHLKNLKNFLWRYGGGMDRVDSFTVTEPDLAKWEKKCMSLKSEAGSANEGCRGSLIGPSNDIHNELNYKIVDSFDKNNVHSFKSSVSNVLPLQNYTNENYQVSNSQLSEVSKVGSVLHDVASSLPMGAQFSKDLWGSKHLTGRICSRDGNLNDGEVCSAKRMTNGESSSQGLQRLNQVSSISLSETRGNVHSGAHPPWFEATELKPESGVISFVSPLSKPGKSHKLNPKRVGAAWAEKRKIELEMERRGEIVTTKCDDNWLPNFGRVWQSGSRKESRKEFEMEKQQLPKVESQSEISVKIQPYISKRMRRDKMGDGSGD